MRAPRPWVSPLAHPSPPAPPWLSAARAAGPPAGSPWLSAVSPPTPWVSPSAPPTLPSPRRLSLVRPGEAGAPPTAFTPAVSCSCRRGERRTAPRSSR
eukprot:4783679-Alexandrium_andersonii.AAC.1